MAAGDIKTVYQAVQTLTNAIEGLAASATFVAGYESAWIDNGTNLFDDYFFQGKITVGTTPTVPCEIRIYVVTSIDDGTTYPDAFDGTTGAETLTNAGVRDGFANLAAVLPVTINTSDVGHPFCFSVAELFGGLCPPDFALFVTHNCTAALNATGGNQIFKYRGVYYNVAQS